MRAGIVPRRMPRRARALLHRGCTHLPQLASDLHQRAVEGHSIELHFLVPVVVDRTFARNRRDRRAGAALARPRRRRSASAGSAEISADAEITAAIDLLRLGN